MANLINCWAGSFNSSSNDYLNCGSHSAFNFYPTLNEFTLGVWVKSAAITQQLAVARGNTSIQYGIGITDVVVNTYIGGQQFDDDADTLAVGIVNDDEWHMLVMVVRTSPQQVSVFMDGQLLSRHNYSGTTTTATDLLIGGCRLSGNTGATNSWEGQLDEVGIWSVALSDDAVAELYNSGYGAMYNEDVGFYLQQADMIAWWRLGDGATENVSYGYPTTTIEDVTGNGYNATLVSGLGPEFFYWGGQTEAEEVPGTRDCLILFSSSSIAISSDEPYFRIDREDIGTTIQAAGYRGNLLRMYLTCTASEGVDTRVFVHAVGRPVPGSTMRSHVFRRVARLQDLASIPKDTPGTTFPFEYRTASATLIASSQAELDAAWIEVQKQCSVLSVDMQAFGAPVQVDGETLYVNGSNATRFGGSGLFPAVQSVPPATSSSSYVAPSIESSSAAPDNEAEASSSAAPSTPVESSSLYVDPYSFQTTIYLDTDGDAIAVEDDYGDKTLYDELPFIRFGRNVDPDVTWNSRVRFKIPIDRFAQIELASIVFSARTAEAGTDVVLRVSAVYEDASLTPISTWLTTDDPGYVHSTTVWDRLAATTTAGQTYSLDVREMLQAFIDRASHSLDDYFAIWIEELASDPGARRDADSLTADNAPYLLVSYRTDRIASSSTEA